MNFKDNRENFFNQFFKNHETAIHNGGLKIKYSMMNSL